MRITRREFFKETAVVAGGLGAVAIVNEPSSTDASAMPKRMLGRTRYMTSLLGFGMAPLGSDNTSPDDMTRILSYAYSQGVNYFDVAPNYGGNGSRYGNAETKMREFLGMHRKDIFLVTKIEADRQDKASVLACLDRSLKRMGVDRVDVAHIHNLGDFDMDRLTGPDGAIAALKEARKSGLIRFIGTSGHMRPARFAKIIDTGDIDITMNALNFADRYNYDFEGQVFPVAKKHKTAVVAMKVLGGTIGWRYDGHTQANLASHYDRAIRYSLGLDGVSCAVIGMNNEEEVRKAVEAVKSFKPLSDMEKTALLEEGRNIAQVRGLYFGPVTG